MTNKEEIIEVFTNFGEFDIQALDPEIIIDELRDSYDVELVYDGKWNTVDVLLVGTYSNILRALMNFWHPGGSDSEAKEEFIEMLDSDFERY